MNKMNEKGDIKNFIEIWDRKMKKLKKFSIYIFCFTNIFLFYSNNLYYYLYNLYTNTHNFVPMISDGLLVKFQTTKFFEPGAQSQKG